MVAIVSGNGLGVSLTSLATLGQSAVAGSATQGSNGERVYVNAATGNLVLQDTDLSQPERGNQSIDSVRTYNSLGSLGPDNWTKGFDLQSLQLTTGTVNTAGSVVTRTDSDGAKAAYAYNATTGLYSTTAGGGAYDTIAYNATTHVYTRTDGTTQMRESYTSAGVLVSMTDSDGNVVTVARNSAGQVASVSDPASATLTYYDYDPTTHLLKDISTKDTSNNKSTWVYYGYDSSNRLTTVTVDLSPGDNVDTDKRTYVTTYSYVGTTAHISTITQSGGASPASSYETSLSFTYDASFRVASVTDQLNNKTTFTYDTVGRNTTVTDPNNAVTVYNYDSLGQLSHVISPTTGSSTATTSYAYNGNGDVTQVTDGAGRVVTMTYDTNGNQTQQQDAAGNTVTRTYDALNHLVTETAYAVPDPDGAGPGTASVPMTTRYVYDPAGQHLLRFVLTPAGRVTEYRYDAFGDRTSTIQYGSAVYDLSSTAATAAPTLAQMTTWIGTQDLTRTARTDVTYDVWGQPTTSTAWSTIDATGAGVADNTQSITHYTYSQSGQLLNTISPLTGSTTYTYDGLGRVLTALNAAGTTTTSYDDVNNKTTVTYANGLVVTSAYDKAGRLLSVMQGSSSTPNLGTTLYAYDADGRLRMTTQPDGVKHYLLYDAGGRQIADIDGNGSLTESVYNNANQLVETIRYVNPLTAAQLATLVDSKGSPANVALSTLRPTGQANTSWTLYDGAGRVSKQVDAAGYVTETRYDGASRVTDVIRYANATTTTVTAASLPSDIAVTASAALDRHTRTLYDNDGHVVGALDGAGFLTESVYDARGNLVHTIAYASQSPSSSWATGTLAQLRPAAAAGDIHTWNYYDDQNRLAGRIDGEGYLTEYGYDVDGNQTRTLRYASKAQTDPSLITASNTLAQLRPSPSALDHSTTAVYNTLDQLASRTDEFGTLTQYVYDNVGHLLSTTSAATTSDARTATQTYDVQGRVTGTLSGRGSAALAQLGASPAAAAVASIWAQYGTTYTYDSAGLRTSMTDGAGNKTLYFYDADGHQTFVVDALGEVTQTRYNALNLVSATIRYGTTISTAGLTGGPDSQVSGLVAQAANLALDSTVGDSYDARGELVQQVDALGYKTTETYDAFGERASKQQDLGGGASETDLTYYDQDANVTETIGDSGGINAATILTRDAFGRATSVTDPNGNVTTTTYDRLGRAVQATDGMTTGKATTSTSYDAFGRTLTTTDGNRQTTTYTWNDGQLTMAMSAPSGASIVTTYDRHGDTLSVRNADGIATTTQYDLDGHVAHTIVDSDSGGLALNTGIDYDTAGRIYDTVDANGVKTVYAYDAANRVVSRTVDPGGLGLLTTYGYDAKGQEITVTDPDGVKTRMTYDLQGETLTRIVDSPDSGPGLALTTTFTFDGRGDTLTSTDPAGTVTTYTYDKLGRRASMMVDSAAGGLNLLTTYAYDTAGNLTQVTDPTGAVTRYVYDADNRVHYTLDAANALTETDYDADGHVVKQVAYATPQTTMTTATAANGTVTNTMGAITTSATDRTTQTTYDVNGRKTLVQVDPNGLNLTTQYAYDNAGNVTRVIDPDGHVTLTGYDAANRAVYSLDGANVLTQTTYTRTGLQQLVTRYAGSPTNVVTTTAPNGSVTSTFNGFAPSAQDSVTLDTYDAAGRKTSVTVNPVSASSPASVALALKTTYDYDANGNVMRTTDPDGNVTRYLYDNAGRLRYALDSLYHLTETDYDGAGRVVAKIVYGDAQMGIMTAQAANGLVTNSFASITPDAALDRVTRYAYDSAGRLVYTIDPIGNVTENQLDADGNVVVQRRYVTPIDLPTAGSTDGKTVTVAGPYAQVNGSTYVPINTAHTYTVTVRARQLSGTGVFYAGVSTKDANGNVIANMVADGGTFAYCAASAVTLTPDMGWQTFSGTITGTYTPTTTTTNPGNAFFAGSVSATPLILYNYGASGNGDPGREVEIDSVTLYDNTTNTTLTLDSGLANGQSSLSMVYGAFDTAASSPSAVLTAAQVKARLRVSAADQITRYAYDQDGRQTFAVDPTGMVTQTSYDALGDVVTRTQYATPIDLPTAGSSDGKTVTVSGNFAGFTAANYAAIDPTHTYTVTARMRQLSGSGTVYAGVVTKDANGNTIGNPYGGSYSYCAAAGVTLTPDMGWVTFSGNITGSYVPSTTVYDQGKFFAGSTQATPLVLYNYYGTNGDPGRDVEIDSLTLTDTTTNTVLNIDPALVNGASSLAMWSGTVDNVQSSTAASLTADQIRARLRLNATSDHITRNVYDADGRKVLTVDPTGAATQFTYDAVGNVTQTRQLATLVPTGNALQVGTDTVNSDASRSLGMFAAGDVVTATVLYKAPVGSQGAIYIGNGSNAGGQTTYGVISANGWQKLTVTYTVPAGGQAMGVWIYGSSPTSTPVIYDDLRITSVQQGTVLDDNFNGDSLSNWSMSTAGVASMTHVSLVDAGTDAQLLALVNSIQDGARDRIMRNVYDADERKVLTVDPTGAATQFAYDAMGNVTQTRQLANAVPTGNALQVNYAANTNCSAALSLGTFQAGDVVTATVRFKATPGANGRSVAGRLYVGDGTSAGGTYGNITPATGGWQTLTVTDTVGATAQSLYVYVYGNRDGAPIAGDSVTYDNLRVTSAQQGVVTDTSLDTLPTGAGVGQWSFASPCQTAVNSLADAGTDAQLLSLVNSMQDNSRDRIARNVYDAAGRLVLTVDPAGQATQTTYDADGNVAQTRQLATPVPTGNVVQIVQVANVGAFGALQLGSFTVGDTITATVRFKSDPTVNGEIYVGDGTTAGGNYSATLPGNNGWQTVTISHVVGSAAPMFVYLYGGATPSLYSDLVITSTQRGVIAADACSSATKGAAIGQWTANSTVLQAGITPADAGTDAQLLTYVNAVVDNTRDRVTRDFYDADGRQVYQVDGRGYVTETRYFTDHTQTIRYASAPALGAAPTTASIATALAGVANQVTDQYVDADGRPTQLINAAGVVSLDEYDGLGRVVRHTDALGLPEQTVTTRTYDADGRVLTLTTAQGTAAAATTVNTYDAFGNLATQVSPEGYALAYADTAWAQATRATLGYGSTAASLTAAQQAALMGLYTTRHAYDLDNRETTTTNAAGATTTTTYDAFGDAVTVVDPLLNTGYFYFDALGRVTLQVDPLGMATETVYTPGFTDKIARVRRYAMPVSTANLTTGTRPALTPTASDAVTSYTYDADGRVLTTTDGAGTESVAYKAVVGSALDVFDSVVVNKLGGATTYLYDQDGDELSETLPVTQNGTAAALGGVLVSNTYQYDGYGNRIQSVEGVNLTTGQPLPEARTTSYRYDAMGRVVYRIGTSYTAADGTSVTPVDYTHYDGLGRVIETRTNASWNGSSAIGGTRTLDYYDAAGNKVMSIAADGGVVAQTFTPTGKVFKNISYTTPIAAATLAGLVAGGTPPVATANVLSDRVQTFGYDSLDRLTTTSLDAVVSWEQVPIAANDNDINLSSTTVVPHTQLMQTLVYDADGNVVQQTDARGNSTYNYYDAAGRKTLSIDPDGYVTAWDYNAVVIAAVMVYNAFDTPIQETRYATALTPSQYARQNDASVSNADLKNPAKIRASAPTSPQPALNADRVTQSLLDTAGRVTEQRTLNVVSNYVDATGAGYTDSAGNATTHTADAVTDYVYDGLGDVTQKSERVAELANSSNVWNVTNYQYDALGRKTAEIDPGYTDYNGATVRPETDTRYDGLGNVSSTVQLGSSGGPANRATTYTYDANGNLKTQTDAAGNVTTYTLDALGRVARTSVQGVAVYQPVFNGDGSVAYNADGSNKQTLVTPAAVVTNFQYDAMGRQTVQTDVGTGQIQFTRYDVFGAITGKGTGSVSAGSTPVYQESTTYNVMGKVESSNTGDGAMKFYVYDANGNTTRQISSNSINLNGLTIDQLINPNNSTNAQYLTHLAQTFSVYDKRNNLTQTVEAKTTFQVNAATEATAYSETQVAPYSGGISTPGANQSVNDGSALPTSTTITSSSGSTLPGGAVLSMSGSAASPHATSTTQPGTLSAVSFPFPATFTTLRATTMYATFYLTSAVPNGTYQLIDTHGTVLASYAKTGALPGGSMVFGHVLSTAYLQILCGNQWITVAEADNESSSNSVMGPVSSNALGGGIAEGGVHSNINYYTNTLNVSAKVGILVTGANVNALVANANLGSSNQQALTVLGITGVANAYNISVPTSYSQLTIQGLDTSGMCVVGGQYNVTSSGGLVTIVTAQPLPIADVWVNYSYGSPSIFFNGSAAGGSGGAFYYRPSSSTTGNWVAPYGMPGTYINLGVGIPDNTYSFRRIMSDGTEYRGSFSVTNGAVSLLNSMVSVAPKVLLPAITLTIPSLAGNIAPGTQGYQLKLKVSLASAPSTPVLSDTVPFGSPPFSYTLSSADMALLNTSVTQNANYVYSYDVYTVLGGAAAQYVGNGTGAFTLGCDSTVTANTASAFKQPVGILNMPSDVPLSGGNVTLKNSGGTTVYYGPIGNDWRITAGAANGTTPVTIDLSPWFATDGSQQQTTFSFSYVVGGKTVSCTLTLNPDGTVQTGAVVETTAQPAIALTLPSNLNIVRIIVSYGAGQTTTISGSSGSWNVQAIATQTSQPFSYQGVDANNNVIAGGSGTFYMNGSALVVSTVPAPTLVFNNVPNDPSDLTKKFTVTGADGFVTSMGNGSWLFSPANLAANGTYSLVYTGTDSDGFVTTSGTVTLQMSNGVASYSNQHADIQPLYLSGPKGYNVPLAQLRLTLPSGPIVLQGRWSTPANAMLFAWIPAANVPVGTPLTMSTSFLDQNGKVYANQFGTTFGMSGTITLGAGGTSTQITQTVTHTNSADEISHYQTSNAFGEVATQRNDLTWADAQQVAQDFGETANSANVVTNLYYNALGQLTEKDDPETSVTDVHGVRTRVQPKTTYGYDLTGRLTITVDANGNATRQTYLGATQQAATQWNPAHWDSTAHAWAYEGATKTSDDILGAVRRTSIDIDGTTQEVTNDDTDSLGNLVRATQLGITRSAQFTGAQAPFNIVNGTIVDTYQYDAFGRRISHTNAYGRSDYTSYDTLGRVVQTVDAQGFKISYQYQFNAGTGGWQLTTGNADGTSTVDVSNYFGQATWHQDEGGDAIAYNYNFDAHLSTQVTTLSATHTRLDNPGVTSTTLQYVYGDDGDILSVYDSGAHTLSQYGYDNAGNRTSESYGSSTDGLSMQVAQEAATIEYDESNRIHRVLDNGIDVSYEYDAVGNRRMVEALYSDPSGGKRLQDDFWYTYDDANRFTMTMGSLVSRGGNIINGTDGVAITYDYRGDRTSAVDAASSPTPGATETYTYTVDGYLQTISVKAQASNVTQLTNVRVADALGRTLDNVTYTYTNGSPTAHHQTSVYDWDNRLQTQTDETSTTTYSYFGSTYVEGASTQAALTAAGPGQLAQISSVASGATTTTTTTAYTYTLWDTADQASITTSSGGSSATTTEHYNAEGFLVEADAVPAGSSTVTKTLYTLSATGLIMLRQQSTGTAAPDTQYFYYAAGRTIGDVSDTRNPDASRMSYAEQWATVTKHGVIDTSQYKTNQPVLAADFDQSYQPINSTYPAAAATSYTVHTGDTLRSIARALWGDADMWYLIAQANNLSASTTLVAGQILSIPNKVTNIHNNANTFRPYDPSEAIGHIDPTLPPPPAPAHGGGCGAIGTIIMVVVAVVATIYTAGLAAEFMGPALASAAGATTMGVGTAALLGSAAVVDAIGVTGVMAAAAIGAAVGSIASQAVGNAIGAQKGFSWKQVATAAVGSAVTAGIGAELAPAATTATGATATSGGAVAASAMSGLSGTAAVEAAAGSTAVQEALKGEWSWRQLAASAVGAAAGQAAGAAMASAVTQAGAPSAASLAQRFVASVGSAWSAQQVLATDPRYTQARTGTMFTNALSAAVEGSLEDKVVGTIAGYEAQQQAQDAQFSLASGMPTRSPFANAGKDWEVPAGPSDYDMMRTRMAVDQALNDSSSLGNAGDTQESGRFAGAATQALMPSGDTASNTGYGGYDPRSLTAAGYPAHAMFLTTPTGKDGEPIEGAAGQSTSDGSSGRGASSPQSAQSAAESVAPASPSIESPPTPVDERNELDKESDTFAETQRAAKDYIDSVGIKLSATQKTYIDQTLQVAAAGGHSWSPDDVSYLVDGVSTTPFPRFASNVYPASISLDSLGRLNDVAEAAGIDVGKLVVTSSARTPAQQAVIMFAQLQDGSISRYGPAGQQVISVYKQGIANGDDADTIRDAMRDKMSGLLDQGIAVSNHFVNLDEMNVFDIGPGTSGMSSAQRQAFQTVLVQAKIDGTVTNFLSPFTGHDPAFHIEIKQ